MITDTVPVACLNTKCKRFKVRVYSNMKRCVECTEDMYPMEEPARTGELIPIVTSGMSRRERKRLRKQLNAGLPIRQLPPQQPQDWTCSQLLRGCPVAVKPTVYIPWSMFVKWFFLAGQIKTEWFIYLKGHAHKEKKNVWVITDMYIPEQKATGAHCEPIDKPGTVEEGTIGAVHSHANMNAFFSKEDLDHMNHDVELVINARGEILADAVSTLECNRNQRGAADIIFTECGEEIELQGAMEAKIQKQPEPTVYHGWGGD